MICWKAYSLMKTFQGLVKWFDSGNYWVTSMSGKFSVIMRWSNDASWTFHEPRKGFILELKQFARLFIYGLGIRIYCYVFKKLLYANSERLWDIEKIRSYNSSNLELSFYITFLQDSLFWQSQYDSISVLWGIEKNFKNILHMNTQKVTDNSFWSWDKFQKMYLFDFNRILLK